jgi:hypothetical protein
MLERKSVVLAKIESSYGVDPVPTVSANALLVSGLTVRPVGEELERDYLKTTLSSVEFVRGVKHYEVSFTVELKGTGTRGVLPAYGWEGVLLRACGFAETVSAGASITYNLVSSAFESCALYVYKDLVLHKLLGARGSARLNFEVGKFGKATFDMKALYAGPADATPSAATYSAIKPPVVLSAGFTVGGYAAITKAIEFNLNNTVSPRYSVNSATGILEWILSARKPGGSFDPEAVTEATHPFWTNWAAATAQALNLGPIGSTSGNILTVTAPKLQYRDISHGERDGIITYETPFGLAMSTGDDELVLTFT